MAEASGPGSESLTATKILCTFSFAFLLTPLIKKSLFFCNFRVGVANAMRGVAMCLLCVL